MKTNPSTFSICYRRKGTDLFTSRSKPGRSKPSMFLFLPWLLPARLRMDQRGKSLKPPRGMLDVHGFPASIMAEQIVDELQKVGSAVIKLNEEVRSVSYLSLQARHPLSRARL